MTKYINPELIACLVGVLVGGLATYLWLDQQEPDPFAYTNPGYSDEYHIHADFLIQIDDQVLGLDQPELMTTSEQELHTGAHLHDNEGEVLHLHEDGITFAEFLESLGFTLTNDCLTDRAGERFCSDEENSLTLFVNDEEYEGDITNYVPADLDRTLLYYGSDPAEAKLDTVADEACIFSGSCPERGVAPPESCGLTCEL